jgi:hypothetical protein
MVTSVFVKIDDTVKIKATFYAQKANLARMGKDTTMNELVENALIYYMEHHSLDNDIRVKEIMKNVSDGLAKQEPPLK